MRALRDFNIPKIVTDDLPVFMGLIGDLFPALDVPRKRDLNFEKVGPAGPSVGWARPRRVRPWAGRLRRAAPKPRTTDPWPAPLLTLGWGARGPEGQGASANPSPAQRLSSITGSRGDTSTPEATAPPPCLP